MEASGAQIQDGQQHAQDESQTQPETQLAPDSQEVGTADLKRKLTRLSREGDRVLKKVKVSIGPAVDLGD